LKITSIPSNFYDVLDYSVVHVGMIQGGTQGNIFPNQALLRGGFRHFKLEGKKKIMSYIRQIAAGVAETYGVDIEVDDLGDNSAPPVINHHEPIARARALVSQVEGLEIDDRLQPICASDNYGYFLLKYPGFYGFLGAMNEEKGIVWAQHHTRFDIDEAALRKGCEFMCRYALDFLG
jgi:metal-dependent amidase/aminoacylase/carboxypeptidase family protein